MTGRRFLSRGIHYRTRHTIALIIHSLDRKSAKERAREQDLYRTELLSLSLFSHLIYPFA